MIDPKDIKINWCVNKPEDETENKAIHENYQNHLNEKSKGTR